MSLTLYFLSPPPSFYHFSSKRNFGNRIESSAEIQIHSQPFLIPISSCCPLSVWSIGSLTGKLGNFSAWEREEAEDFIPFILEMFRAGFESSHNQDLHTHHTHTLTHSFRLWPDQIHTVDVWTPGLTSQNFSEDIFLINQKLGIGRGRRWF